MSTKIEQKIDEIEELVQNAKPTLMSKHMISIEAEQIEELITELRALIPDEIKRYQKMVANKEQILADAQAKADQIIAQAQIQTNQLVSEHQIMQQAYAQANEVVLLATKQAQDILDRATSEANAVKMSAMSYTDDQLRIIEEVLTGSIENQKLHTDRLVTTLQGYLDVVSANRASLFPEPEPEVTTVDVTTIGTTDSDN